VNSSFLNAKFLVMAVKKILVGEYANYIIYDDGNVDTHDNAQLVTFPLPEKIVDGSAGHPWATVIGESGKVYFVKGDSTEVDPLTESDSKKPIRPREKRKKPQVTVVRLTRENIVACTSFYTHHVLINKAGDLLVFPDSNTDDVVALKTNGKIVAAVGASFLLALDEDGNVWRYDWIESGKIVKPNDELAVLQPKLIDLPGPATAIATSRSYFSGAIVNKEIYVWCESSYGTPFINTNSLTPVKATELWDIPEPVEKIWMADNTTHFITSSGKLFGCGNTWVGEVGDGSKDPRVLEGNADMAYKTYVFPAAHLNPDRKYKELFGGTYYAFRHFAMEDNGSVDSWGYGKFGLLLNGIKPEDDASYVGTISVATPRRFDIPEELVYKTTEELQEMVADGTYPPPEADAPTPPPPEKKLLTTIKVFDDGSVENNPA
jgi:alpha-tubulin suppressor-like RCC1 family protein